MTQAFTMSDVDQSKEIGFFLLAIIYFLKISINLNQGHSFFYRS